jgi:hypothetical protein
MGDTAPANGSDNQYNCSRVGGGHEPTSQDAGDCGIRVHQLQAAAGSSTGEVSGHLQPLVDTKGGPCCSLQVRRDGATGGGFRAELLQEPKVDVRSELPQKYRSMDNSKILQNPLRERAPVLSQSWGNCAGPDLAHSEDALVKAVETAQLSSGAAAGQRGRGGRRRTTDVVRVTLARRPSPAPTADSVDMQADNRSPHRTICTMTAGTLQHARARPSSSQPVPTDPARFGRVTTFAAFERHLDRVLADAAMDSPQGWRQRRLGCRAPQGGADE